MTAGRLVLGTRGSALARAQAGLVRAELLRLHSGLAVEVRVVRTRGDDGTSPLWEVGGRGLFTKELEQSLLAGEVDAAVHSLKDLPTQMKEGLALVVPARGDARDALVTREGLSLDALPPGTAVGTSSLRRMAQLICARPDLRPRNLRGNVDTRLAQVASGELQAAVMAAAGIARLGKLPDGIRAVPLPVEHFVPAAGQGALAVQYREAGVLPLLEPLRDPATERAVAAERALLAELKAGCHVPLGAHAVMAGNGVNLTTFLAYPDGRNPIRLARTGTASAVVAETAAALRAAGAQAILDFVDAATARAMAKERR